ncbi:MAG: flavodoxin domain-containing protein [Patescibacteria group bacterium]|nr:flavodoxin domain-containing protein [Patescibacteria group bacterium]
MKILVIYATYSGGTQVACEFVIQFLQEWGHDVELKQISQVSSETFDSFDLLIFASPSWNFEDKEGQPHQDFLSWINKNQEINLAKKKTAVFGLGDSSYTSFCGAVDIIKEFLENHNATVILPTLKIDGYLFNQEKNNVLIKEWLKKIIA